jgi:hypothetical protein
MRVTNVTKRRKPAENCQKWRHKPENGEIELFYAVQHKDHASTNVNAQNEKGRPKPPSDFSWW